MLKFCNEELEVASWFVLSEVFHNNIMNGGAQSKISSLFWASFFGLDGSNSASLFALHIWSLVFEITAPFVHSLLYIYKLNNSRQILVADDPFAHKYQSAYFTARGSNNYSGHWSVDGAVELWSDAPIPYFLNMSRG